MKKNFKGIIIGTIIGVLLCSIVGVCAVTYFPSNQTTYDNTTSGLKSTDVQGAIDELYNACKTPPTAGGSILDKVDIVTSGDGLYKDEYEDGKYTYKGANPNNYVTFNNEQASWRIVSINSDGTIKIMRSESIGNRAWDSSSNNWAHPASLNTYLNGTYYSSFTSTAQSQVVAKDWSIGVVTNDNNDLADQISDENGIKWNGKVALVTLSEYIRSNSNKNSCGSLSLNNNNSSSCKNTTWMFNNTNWWTLSPFSGDSRRVFIVPLNGYVNNSYVDDTRMQVRPTITLSSEVKITGGDGSQSNPYTIQ